MINLFRYDSYLEFIKDLVEDRSEQGKTKAELARAMGCQAAYFSQVLKGEAHFTEDHIANLANYLQFTELETEFLLLLLRKDKTGSSNLRKHLEGKKEKILSTVEDLEENLNSKRASVNEELARYYSTSWIPSAVHAATSCENLNTVALISQRFNLPEDIVEYHLGRLERFRLVKFENKRWHYVGGSIHFAKKSDVDFQFQMSRRLVAMNALTFRRDENMHYAAFFTADEENFKKLRAAMMKSITQLHKLVEPVKGQEIYAICLDLFKL